MISTLTAGKLIVLPKYLYLGIPQEHLYVNTMQWQQFTVKLQFSVNAAYDLRIGKSKEQHKHT